MNTTVYKRYWKPYRMGLRFTILHYTWVSNPPNGLTAEQILGTLNGKMDSQDGEAHADLLMLVIETGPCCSTPAGSKNRAA